MWPFTRSDSTQTELRLDDRVSSLEKQLREIVVEWEEWYDKYRRLYARISKRAERDGEAAESRQDARHGTNGHQEGQTPPKRPIRSLRGF